jgi:serine/threonine protein kinase
MAAALPAFIGRYEVKQRLGQGGMGVIYLARDPAIDRLVAVKLLDPDITTDELRQRFAQEARSSGALTHPHIVTIHDFGEVEGVPYLVMEYVQGETMAALIKRAAPIPVAQKLRWIEQACRALGYAHQRRVIHRDVKPSNLMIDEQGTVKVVDFGIARSLVGGTTKLSTVIGTPAYMSPEQIQGAGIDARSDIFGLGTVLYELLTYKPAFGGESPHAIMHQVVSGQPQPLAEQLTGPDLSIAGVVEQAMQKSPDARFADMAAFEAAVRQARTALEASGREITIRTPGPPSNDRNQSRRRRTDPADLARRRADQIAAHLQDAQRARRDGKLEAAIAACENALLMDPASVEALDLIEELRQESTGAALSATSQITTAPPTRVTALSTQPAETRTARIADLADMELRPRSVEDRPTGTGTVRVAAPSVAAAPTSRRAHWPLVAGIVIAVGAAAAVALQGGFVSFDGESDESEAVELAMPAVPEVAAGAPTPGPAPRATPTPPPVASGPPSPPSVSDVATTQREPDAPAASTVEAPPAPTVDSPLEPAPNEPRATGAPDALPETPPAGADAPTDTAGGSIDREAVARLLLRGEGAERNGNLADALNQYREVLKQDPRNRIAERAILRLRVDMILRRAESLVLVGNYDAALKELAAVAVYDPTNARAEELREAIEQGKSYPARKKP